MCFTITATYLYLHSFKYLCVPCYSHVYVSLLRDLWEQRCGATTLTLQLSDDEIVRVINSRKELHIHKIHLFTAFSPASNIYGESSKKIQRRDVELELQVFIFTHCVVEFIKGHQIYIDYAQPTYAM